MKQREAYARKAAFIGAGIGLAVFGLFGLLQGSLIGGTIGLDIINRTMGAAGESLLSRIILAASMLAGILVAGVIFIVVFSAAGWTAGYVIGVLTQPKGQPEFKEKTGH